MVSITICGMCKYFLGLNKNKTCEICKAFPNGITISANGKDKCFSDFSFEPTEKWKEICESEWFKRNYK